METAWTVTFSHIAYIVFNIFVTISLTGCRIYNLFFNTSHCFFTMHRNERVFYTEQPLYFKWDWFSNNKLTEDNAFRWLVYKAKDQQQHKHALSEYNDWQYITICYSDWSWCCASLVGVVRALTGVELLLTLSCSVNTSVPRWRLSVRPVVSSITQMPRLASEHAAAAAAATHRPASQVSCRRDVGGVRSSVNTASATVDVRRGCCRLLDA